MVPWSGNAVETFEHDRPLFENFLDVMPDSVLGVEEDGSIVFANSRAEELFRRTHDDLIGEPIESLIPQRFRNEQSDASTGYFAARMDQPYGANIHMYLSRSDGSEFAAEITLSSLQLAERTIQAAAIRDVTDRVHSETEHKRLEQELALNQARRLESIGELAGGIAHDFNNLLGVIINYAELAVEAVDDPVVKEDVEQIMESALRAAALTRQLLIFSRREIVKPVPVALNDIIIDVKKLLVRTIGEQIELQTDLASELSTVVVDPGQFEQIIVNLAVNARDAMPHGGILKIDTVDIELTEDELLMYPGGPPPGKYVQMTVSDSGAGMAPAVLNRAFEPFFTTKGRTEGTGLGLATVYGIVNQAGGNVLIYSELDHGTSVKVYLPTSDAAVADWKAKRAPTPAKGHGEYILVVEDEDALRRLVARVLGEKGYNVIAQPDVDAALALLGDQSVSVDLLLTDVVMPGMQGSELARRALEMRPSLKVLLMSGYSEATIARIDGRQDELDLVEKPFTRSQLLREVNSSLNKPKEARARL